MNTLRQAVDDYLNMRRHLGFQLREAGNALLDFVDFMEQHQASYRNFARNSGVSIFEK
jgi:hypothetical protein